MTCQTMVQSVTAVIPAAGRATRLGSTTSGSKEVVEIGGEPVLSHFLRRLAVAGIRRALISIRAAKLDIPAALTRDATHGVDVAYTIVSDSPSPAHSIAPALQYAADDVIALGFPDVIFQPRDAFAPMLVRLAATDADLVFGVFPSAMPDRVDMVRLDENRRVTEIVIKQPDRGLAYCWTLAVWNPSFTDFLLKRIRTCPQDDVSEFQIGGVVQEAIDGGMHIESVVFDDGRFVDVGTPADLEAARRDPDFSSR